mmetsp:Transcript_30983/g.95271  ORF Transcript_30983/g.95271 Transcript_30983/m.95271 type:complete len:310 (+) Transcript_30983:282-1211(+)
MLFCRSRTHMRHAGHHSSRLFVCHTVGTLAVIDRLRIEGVIAKNVHQLKPVDVVQKGDKVCRILFGKQPWPWVHAHHLDKLGRVHRNKLGGGFCGEVALVPPIGPEHWLADPILLIRRGVELHPIHHGVRQAPALDKVHLLGHVTPAEDGLLLGIGLRLQHISAEPVHDHLHVGIQVFEERVEHQVLRVHLMRHLVLQRLRQPSEDLDVFRLYKLALNLHLVLQELEDPIREVVRHIPLSEIAAQKPELFHVICLHVPQTRRGPRDARDYRGEGDQGEKQHDYREDPLPRVSRTDIHGCGRELRETPMQ